MAVFSAFLSIIKIEQVKRTVIMKKWFSFKSSEKEDISQLPFIPVGKNGSYRINFANKTVAQNIYNSLKEMEKIPVQRAEIK